MYRCLSQDPRNAHECLWGEEEGDRREAYAYLHNTFSSIRNLYCVCMCLLCLMHWQDDSLPLRDSLPLLHLGRPSVCTIYFKKLIEKKEGKKASRDVDSESQLSSQKTEKQKDKERLRKWQKDWGRQTMWGTRNIKRKRKNWNRGKQWKKAGFGARGSLTGLWQWDHKHWWDVGIGEA